MTGHDDRDRAIERLLPQVLGGAASTSCVDGETLAAWSEGALRPNDSALVEAHVADCARCQAMVGAFVRISPAPLVTESAWQRWRLGWLLPLATAAAAVALFAVILRPTVRQESQVTLADARRDVPATAAPATPPPAAQREVAPLAAPSGPSGGGQVMKDESKATIGRGQVMNQAPQATDALAKKRKGVSERAEPATPSQRLQETVTITGAAPAAEMAALESRRARNDAPSAPAPAQPLIEQRKAVEERVAVAPTAAPAAAPAPARPNPPPPPAASPAPVPPATPPAEPTMTSRPLPTAAAAGGRAAADRAAASGRTAEFGATLNATAIEIPTPVASTRWRLAAPSGVQRTTNNGATWVDVPGVDVNPLRAGSAPTVNVCWIVGTIGRVYLTSDGLRFTRVAFPETIDLVAVRATDVRTAVVTSADGRTFRTTDGGASWTR